MFHTSEHWPDQGADKAHDTQAPFYELLGIPRSRLVSGPMVADEVVIPQVGHSHNPYLNLWGLFAIREAVEKMHGVERKSADAAALARPLEILVIVRDKGRRRDDGYFTQVRFCSVLHQRTNTLVVTLNND